MKTSRFLQSVINTFFSKQNISNVFLKMPSLSLFLSAFLIEKTFSSTLLHQMLIGVIKKNLANSLVNYCSP